MKLTLGVLGTDISQYFDIVVFALKFFIHGCDWIRGEVKVFLRHLTTCQMQNPYEQQHQKDMKILST